jgi:hypothetical protein
MSADTSLSLKRFVLRSWIYHAAVTFTFFVLLVLIVRPHYADFTATHKHLLINLAAMILCWVHTLLILIFSMRRFSRKETNPGLIFLLHFFLSATLGYYAGWLFAGGVIHDIIPG